MSLVHEALQKAAREKQRQTGPVVPVAPRHAKPAAPAVPAPAPSRSPLILLGAAVGTVAVVGIVAIVWLVSRGGPVAPPREPVAVEPPAAPVARAVEEMPPAAVEPLPGFKLTGIMKDPSGAFAAVLNGRVVFEGHYVDGATVKRIERDRLIIEVNGRESTLRLF